MGRVRPFCVVVIHCPLSGCQGWFQGRNSKIVTLDLIDGEHVSRKKAYLKQLDVFSSIETLFCGEDNLKLNETTSGVRLE